MNLKSISVLLFATSIAACGGDDGEITAAVDTGVFIDSAVSGLRYSTASRNGVTNADGEFNYLPGESATFSIGDITFPEVLASPTVSPLDVFSTQDINHVAVVNMLRLLQSLDVDGDASNGIQISDLSHQLATGLSLDFADSNFDPMVQALIASSGGEYTSLISSQQATDHFSETMASLANSACTSDHRKVGYSGAFSTRAHNVSGVATIEDDCTIKISQFTYDGGGPEVYFYGGVDHQYANASAFAIGEKISGLSFSGQTVRLTLPEGKSLDDLTGISVWCVDVRVDFGHLEFSAP